MKTKIIHGWRWIFAVSSTITLLGCLDQTSGTGAQTVVPSATVTATPSSAEPQTETLPAPGVIPPANLSPGVEEVVKLAQSGVGESVLLAYVEKSNLPFNPSVDELVYLKDIGVPDAVVTAMVRHAETANQSNLPAIENKPAAEQTPNNLGGPSLIDPNAPSYSVAAETNYNEAASGAQAPQQVNINYFESTLSPYGSWVDVPDYGRCWQPTVVIINHDWRPYADRGRWLYTSSGWYWQSDYSWGWAAFHYGRWHCDNRIGWVWVPGSTWGPAWVSWRYTDQYCGWAPLPPSARYYDGLGFYYRNSRVGISFDFGLNDDCYTFIPTSRFCDRSPSHFYVSRTHSKTIYKNSVVINNYVRGHNSIVNEGIGRERITRATHTPIRTVALRELPATSSPAGKAERLEGGSLTVFRPNVSSSGRTIPQRSVTVTQPTHNTKTPMRGVTGISKSQEVSTTPKLNSTAKTFPVTRTLTPRFSPEVASRNSLPTPAQRETSPSPQPVQRSIVTTQPSASALRNFPARSSATEIDRRSRHEVAVESPRASEQNIVRSVPQTPAVRTTPSVPRFEQPQPSVREIRRQETPDFSRNTQRSVRSVSPPSSAPVQNFNQPREINRGVSRIERSAPPQVSQPRPSSPAPSIRQSAPRQESPSRSRSERSVERSSRSERNRS
jgi:hypothetical protein